MRGTPVREDLDLLDWRRRVADIYAEVRRRGPSETTWRWWRDERDELFASHPSSPLPVATRAAFTGLPVFPYDPDLRLGPLEVHDAEPRHPRDRPQLGGGHAGAPRRHHRPAAR